MNDESSLRHRPAFDGNKEASGIPSTSSKSDLRSGSDEDEESPTEDKLEDLTKTIPQATDNLGAIVDSALSALPTR